MLDTIKLGMPNTAMLKQAAIDFFGSPTETADAIGISVQAVSDWPKVLPRRIADRVIAAAVRKGLKVPRAFLVMPDKAAA